MLTDILCTASGCCVRVLFFSLRFGFVPRGELSHQSMLRMRAAVAGAVSPRENAHGGVSRGGSADAFLSLPLALRHAIFDFLPLGEAALPSKSWKAAIIAHAHCCITAVVPLRADSHALALLLLTRRLRSLATESPARTQTAALAAAVTRNRHTLTAVHITGYRMYSASGTSPPPVAALLPAVAQCSALRVLSWPAMMATSAPAFQSNVLPLCPRLTAIDWQWAVPIATLRSVMEVAGRCLDRGLAADRRRAGASLQIVRLTAVEEDALPLLTLPQCHTLSLTLSGGQAEETDGECPEGMEDALADVLLQCPSITHLTIGQDTRGVIACQPREIDADDDSPLPREWMLPACRCLEFREFRDCVPLLRAPQLTALEVQLRRGHEEGACDPLSIAPGLALCGGTLRRLVLRTADAPTTPIGSLDGIGAVAKSLLEFSCDADFALSLENLIDMTRNCTTLKHFDVPLQQAPSGIVADILQALPCLESLRLTRSVINQDWNEPKRWCAPPGTPPVVPTHFAPLRGTHSHTDHLVHHRLVAVDTVFGDEHCLWWSLPALRVMRLRGSASSTMLRAGCHAFTAFIGRSPALAQLIIEPLSPASEADAPRTSKGHPLPADASARSPLPPPSTPPACVLPLLRTLEVTAVAKSRRTPSSDDGALALARDSTAEAFAAMSAVVRGAAKSVVHMRLAIEYPWLAAHGLACATTGAAPRLLPPLPGSEFDFDSGDVRRRLVAKAEEDAAEAMGHATEGDDLRFPALRSLSVARFHHSPACVRVLIAMIDRCSLLTSLHVQAAHAGDERKLTSAIGEALPPAIRQRIDVVVGRRWPSHANDCWPPE